MGSTLARKNPSARLFPVRDGAQHQEKRFYPRATFFIYPYRYRDAVIPAKAGVHLRRAAEPMDSRFRGNDGQVILKVMRHIGGLLIWLTLSKEKPWKSRGFV
jgi:hypothetical protein